ncbi:MAG: ParB/RepB/Spo0J family partition protein [Clostridia bacterium]
MLNIEKSIPIPLEKLVDFPNHPFKVNDDKEMEKMVETVKQGGIINPLIVRQREDGNYEIISGHRRRRASQLANLKEVPCIIRNLTDDEATIIMVDSNLQRERILPSEKAFAYKMKLEAQKHQGKRTDLTSCQVGTRLRSDEKLAENSEDSARQIQRYVRLTELIPELLELVDKEKDGIAFNPAVELSYLKEDEQYVLLNLIEFNGATPSQSQAKYMKKLSQEERLTTEKMEEIMGEQKPNQVEKIKINAEKIQELLPRDIITEKQTEEFIIKCIKEHNHREERKKEMVR